MELQGGAADGGGERLPRLVRTVPLHPVIQTKGPARTGPFSVKMEHFLPAVLADDVVNDAVRLIDVTDGAIAQTTHGGIIFLAGDIIVGLIE